MHMTNPTYDTTKPFLWRMTAGQVVCCVVIVFSAGGLYAGLSSALSDNTKAIETINNDGPKVMRGLPDKIITLAERVTKVEAQAEASSTNNVATVQRSAADAEIMRSNERRVAALESNTAQLLPAVKEIQVNTQWLMKQQGGK